MIKTKTAVQPTELTKAEAQTLTDRIRNAVEDIRKLVAKAHDGKAWKALGYRTWEDYVKTEFGISKRHADRLVQQGEVIQAIEDATSDLGPMGPISERAARELAPDLPAAVEEIKARAEKGEDPAKAAKEIAAAKRAEKERQREERKQEQAKNAAASAEHAAKLPDSIKAMEARKQEAVAAKRAKAADDGLTLEERIAELEEAVRVLEEENAALKAENKLFSEMKAEWEKGGFEEVIRGKDEVIRAQATRIETESRDKASWKRSADYWKAEAVKLGWSNVEVIDIETGEVVDA